MGKEAGKVFLQSVEKQGLRKVWMILNTRLSAKQAQGGHEGDNGCRGWLKDETPIIQLLAGEEAN